MSKIKCVIGANYGDEGKGVTSKFFSEQARIMGESIVNVLYNGGVQRGHTAHGHVFHCFGAGALDGADTYYTEDFMANPLGWAIEFKELECKPMLYINERCRITTPYDAFINQKLEEKRGVARHGSCGMGILETRLRSEHGEYAIFARDLMDEDILYEKLKKIRDEYFPARCAEVGVDTILNEEDTSMFDKFITFSSIMARNDKVKIINDDERIFLSNYDTIIFEGGQGLRLSEANTRDFPHLTPSYTGAENIIPYLKNLEGEVEVCYVTRPYLTRHGAGPLDGECTKEEIGDIIDTTNIPNDWQGSIRFGKFKGIIGWIYEDFYKFQYSGINCNISLSITCLDQTDGELYSSFDGVNLFLLLSCMRNIGYAHNAYKFYGAAQSPVVETIL